MKKVLGFLSLILLMSVSGYAQKAATVEEVKFKTSAKCGMCKERIEHDLSLTKGVEKAVLNLDDKTVSISYNAKKTSPEKLKVKISKIGYDADEVIADQKAHDRLPDCCQKTADAHQ
ncbi:MAG: heavy metal-associated domain-containing protein [Spirosomataceae bacterium]|jgi:copper chaperone CopZ|nr:heavy-metal-associated domain-containing protein [Bacteroidota bacterium]